MCLILLAHKTHSKYKLIIAANRDEFYERATVPADYWQENPDVLAGKDLIGGGTWMGMNTCGELCMLTNYRDVSNIRADAPSRGHLVLDFLQNKIHATEYMQAVAAKGGNYNGFNLLCGNIDDLYYYGNYQQNVHQIIPGVHGLSNALFNTPWPKIKRGTQMLQNLIDRDDITTSTLFTMLYDDIKAPTELLPNTGVGLEKETMLSPMFIKSRHYGSRCSTVILVDQDNQVRFAERTYNVNDFTFEDKIFEFEV